MFCFTGSAFRDRVLMCLAKSVPVGKTITYGELASLAGSPGKAISYWTISYWKPIQHKLTLAYCTLQALREQWEQPWLRIHSS